MLLVFALINVRALRRLLLNISDGTFLYVLALALLVFSFFLLSLLLSPENRQEIFGSLIAIASLIVIVAYTFWGSFMVVSLLRATDL